MLSTSPARELAPAKRPLRAFIACAAVLGLVVSAWHRHGVDGMDRDHALESALRERGLVADREGLLWLELPPFGVVRAATRRVGVVVRARPGVGEPHDIYLVSADLSPEGALLGVGRAHNLTETSAVDERRPVGSAGWFAFIEQPMLGDEAPYRIKLVDLAGEPGELRHGWSRLERLQAALTRYQDTGRVAGARQVAYAVEPASGVLALEAHGDRLRIDADGRICEIAMSDVPELPQWLAVESVPERRPGSLVTWAVDRVRAEIGDEAMQYIKAVAFSTLDVVLSRKEELTGDTGEAGIAEDLGQDSLEQAAPKVPVDPEIGFPPAPLEPWVTPALPGEGSWNAKIDPAFFHVVEGLPPTFVTTFIRSDQRRKATRVYVALWDPRVMQLNMMAGVSEPKSATGATGPGLIPREPTVLSRVTAAMNAGFQALHGEFGMMSDGVIYLPPKPYSATVATLRDGSTAFGTWPEDPAIPSEMLSYRQNMTPIVIDKTFNPYGRTWWGGTPSDWEDKTHTVRTGICVTEEGFVGYFYGADVSPEALARAMIQTRCSYGVALDMNAGHSGLEFYKVAPAADLPAPEGHLAYDWEREGDIRGFDGWKFRSRRLIRGMGLMNFPRYIGREGRDFFYLTLRYMLPGPPLVAAAHAPKAELDGRWQIKGLPQHGFPYALARTELGLASGARVRILAIDPRMITLDAADARDGDRQVVAQLEPIGAPGDGALSLWSSSGAFSTDTEARVAGATRLATGASGLERAAAALGVQQESGMLLYVEAFADAESATVPADELVAVLTSAGCGAPLLLPEAWALALGGDTSLAGKAMRAPGSSSAVTLLRHRGPGVRRIFESTPIVPLQKWYPLQTRRIRYFKQNTDS